MLRYLRYLILGLLGLLLLVLAMANRAPVGLSVFPEDVAVLLGVNWGADVPLFLVILASVALGLVLGFLWEWAREHKHRAAAAKGTRQVARLERELAVMKDSISTPQDDVLAILDGKKKTG